MLRSGRPVGLVALTVLAFAATACGSSSPSAPNPTAGSSRGTSTLSGPLTVFAAASLTEAFKDAEKTLERDHPGFVAAYSFAGSQQLVTSIKSGAPVDVIATADMRTMQTLLTAGLVETPRPFVRNKLEIAVARGNPKGIRNLSDLAKPSLNVVLADPSVPAGKFARQALRKAGVTVTPKSNELDVKSALEKVESGDADAAIVYTTDVSAAGTKVDGVAIAASQNVIAVYPIAIVKGTQNRATAAAFVEEAVSGEIQAALRKRGFLAP